MAGQKQFNNQNVQEMWLLAKLFHDQFLVKHSDPFNPHMDWGLQNNLQK